MIGNDADRDEHLEGILKLARGYNSARIKTGEMKTKLGVVITLDGVQVDPYKVPVTKKGRVSIADMEPDAPRPERQEAKPQEWGKIPQPYRMNAPKVTFPLKEPAKAQESVRDIHYHFHITTQPRKLGKVLDNLREQIGKLNDNLPMRRREQGRER